MSGSDKYVRYVVKDKFKPYNPVELTEITRCIVCRVESNGLMARKYTDFYVVWVYQGIATGYAVGCNLRCVFCWSDFSRDFPERYGEFYSSEEVAQQLLRHAKLSNVSKVRVSGGEPTLCREHLLQVIDIVEKVPDIDIFLLETNGILFGWDESYVKDIAQYRKVIVRVSVKAAFPETFTRKTGALPEFYELPFKAIKHLLKHGVEVYVAAMTDPRIMSIEERRELFKKLSEIEPNLAQTLEEENIDPYETTLVRLEKAGLEIF